MSGSGVQVLSTLGVLETIVLPTDSGLLAMDDAGAMYVGTQSAPLSSGTAAGRASITKYAFRSNLPLATYSLSNPAISSFSASGAGQLVAASTANGVTTIEVWNAGSSGGSADRVFHYAALTDAYTGGNAILNSGVVSGHDGQIYVPYFRSGSAISYDVYAPGSSTPNRRIDEAIVPAATRTFYQSSMAVGSDGTLYVTQWRYNRNDPYAGLYVYPPSGAETFQPDASGPLAVQLDAAGNVYVLNNNAADNANGGPDDTAHNVFVYGLRAASLTRVMSGNWTSAQAFAIAPDGTAFVSSSNLSSSGIYTVAPSGTVASRISTANTFSLTTSLR